MTRILIVEDNRDFAATLELNLDREGYRVEVAHTGTAGLDRIRANAPDLVILDLMLPELNGYTVLQRLREEGRTMPVLVMTARGTEDEKLRGFGLGADDYIVKPCGLREILARVKALLRRAGATGVEPAEVTLLDLKVDFAARVVRRGRAEIALRPKEFDLLAALIRHRGRVVSREELLREVWGYSADTQSRTLETHMGSLRERLGDSADARQYIVTVRRAGYRIAESL